MSCAEQSAPAFPARAESAVRLQAYAGLAGARSTLKNAYDIVVPRRPGSEKSLYIRSAL